MSINFKDNHIEEGLALLISQFKEKDNIEALLTAFLTQIQELEDVASSLITDRTISSAVGEQLNILGRIVGQPREGRDDDTYRLWIQARILINRSSGTAEEIYTVLKLLTQQLDEGSFKIADEYPARFVITLYDAISTEDAQTIFDIVEFMKPICIDFDLVYFIESPVFRLDIGPGLDQGHLAGQL